MACQIYIHIYADYAFDKLFSEEKEKLLSFITNLQNWSQAYVKVSSYIHIYIVYNSYIP